MNGKGRKGEGPELTAEQMHELAVKAHANAVELVDEAELLFQHGHFARCVFLTQIAGEELGKCHMTITSIPRLVWGKMNWPRFWQRFRSHKEKASGIHFFETVASARHDIEPLEAITHTVSTLEMGKMLSLYSEQMENGAMAPSDWVKEEIAANALSWARGRLSLFAVWVVPLLDKAFVDTFTAGDMRVRAKEVLQAMEIEDSELSKKLFDLIAG